MAAFFFWRREAMQMDMSKRVISKPLASAEDEKAFQAQLQSDLEPFESGSGSPPDLRQATEDLKAKIAEARNHNDLPADSALGSPTWERSAAAGRFNILDEDDD